MSRGRGRWRCRAGGGEGGKYLALELDFLFILVSLVVVPRIICYTRGLTLYGAYHFASLVFPLITSNQRHFFSRRWIMCTHCRFWIRMNESTILRVGCLLGAWVRQSSGTKCRRAEAEVRPAADALVRAGPTLAGTGTGIRGLNLRPIRLVRIECRT